MSLSLYLLQGFGWPTVQSHLTPSKDTGIKLTPAPAPPPSQDPAVASLQGTRKVFALKIHGAVGSQGLPCTDGTQTLTVATKHPQVGQRFDLLVAWVC